MWPDQPQRQSQLKSRQPLRSQLLMRLPQQKDRQKRQRRHSLLLRLDLELSEGFAIVLLLANLVCDVMGE